MEIMLEESELCEQWSKVDLNGMQWTQLTQNHMNEWRMIANSVILQFIFCIVQYFEIWKVTCERVCVCVCIIKNNITFKNINTILI